jgi:hypothetical protein
MVTQTLDDMVNFRDMSNAERRYIRPFIPFYSWLSGISRRTVRMLTESPEKAAFLNYEGMQGKEYMDNLWGDVQDFVLTYFPLSIPGSKDKVMAMKTSGLNPMSSIADISGAARALVGAGDWKGSENPMSTINPIMKSAIEAFTGTDMFYNNTLEDYRAKSLRNGRVTGGNPDASKLGVFAKRVALSLPQVNLAYQGLREPYPNDQTPGKKYAAWNYAGYPVIAVNAREAAKRGHEETQYELRKQYAEETLRRFEAANG